MIKGVVFDLDHTLYDRYATMTEIARYFYQDHQEQITDGLTLADVTGRIIDADRKFVHFGWKLIHKHLVESGLYKTPLPYEDYLGYMMGKFGQIAVPFDFSIPLLDNLHKGGLKTGLITNGKPELQYAKLDLLGLRGYFDKIIVSGEFGHAKPGLEPFVAMARWLDAEPGELLYVGDHPLNDVQASRKAGYLPVWVKTTGSWVMPEIEMPPLVIGTVAEIPGLLQSLQGSQA